MQCSGTPYAPLSRGTICVCAHAPFDERQNACFALVAQSCARLGPPARKTHFRLAAESAHVEGGAASAPREGRAKERLTAMTLRKRQLLPGASSRRRPDAGNIHPLTLPKGQRFPEQNHPRFLHCCTSVCTRGAGLAPASYCFSRLWDVGHFRDSVGAMPHHRPLP